MRSRIPCVLMATAICLGMLTTCGKSDESSAKKQITLIAEVPPISMYSVANTEINDSQEFLKEAAEAFSAQYEDADVTIDVKLFDYVDETKVITGNFDTEYATDILFEDYFNMLAYVYTGRVVPLNDIITDEIYDDIYESAWNMSSIDGKVYMMPYLSRQNLIIYNKSLMEQAGLNEYVADDGSIQNWTTDEWTEILDTLAEKLPDGVYPMFMYGKNNQGDTHIMSLIRAFGSNIFDSEGNFDFESDEAVTALTWISEGVKKGWFPTHCENLEITDNQELFNNNQLVFYFFNNANIPLYDNIEDYGFVNFPNNVATSFVTGFEVFDNGDDEKVKVAKDFIKYIYETDEWLDISAGNIPESKKVTEKYQDSITMLSEFSANEANVVDFMNNSPNWQGSDTSVRSVFYPHIHDLLTGSITPQECASALDEDCNKALEIGRSESVLHD